MLPGCPKAKRLRLSFPKRYTLNTQCKDYIQVLKLTKRAGLTTGIRLEVEVVEQ